MRTVLMVAAAFAALVCASATAEGIVHAPRPLRAEGISPPLKRPLILLACQQKLCPGPKKPLVQLAEGDWQHMKRPPVADISPWIPRPLTMPAPSRPALAYGELACCPLKRPLLS